jgi:hypothetical protein
MKSIFEERKSVVALSYQCSRGDTPTCKLCNQRKHTTSRCHLVSEDVKTQKGLVQGLRKFLRFFQGPRVIWDENK